jgi:hypothetical protein
MKDGRALRIQTVINDTYDLGCGRLLHNLGELQAPDAWPSRSSTPKSTTAF